VKQATVRRGRHLVPLALALAISQAYAGPVAVSPSQISKLMQRQARISAMSFAQLAALKGRLYQEIDVTAADGDDVDNGVAADGDMAYLAFTLNDNHYLTYATMFRATGGAGGSVNTGTAGRGGDAESSQTVSVQGHVDAAGAAYGGAGGNATNGQAGAGGDSFLSIVAESAGANHYVRVSGTSAGGRGGNAGPLPDGGQNTFGLDAPQYAGAGGAALALGSASGNTTLDVTLDFNVTGGQGGDGYGGVWGGQGGVASANAQAVNAGNGSAQATVHLHGGHGGSADGSGHGGSGADELITGAVVTASSEGGNATAVLRATGGDGGSGDVGGSRLEPGVGAGRHRWQCRGRRDERRPRG